MAGHDVIISMSLIKVEISRSWLYAELFSHYELDLPELVPQMSPGPQRLRQLMESGQT